MKDEMGFLIRLTHLESVWFPIFPLTIRGWAAFLTGVLHPSSHTPNSILVQQTSMGPTGSPASGAFLVENV